MVKLFGLVFAALLVCAHFADVQGDAYQRPLSMFRDYEPAWIGYALFGMLVAIGLETVRTAIRVQAELHAAVYLLATGLLAVVAATPSYDALHTTCALVALFMMYVYYAVLLYRGDSMFWLVLHLLTPSLLMMASRLESYGVWQKGMILYFLAAAVVHQGWLAQWLPRRTSGRPKRIRIQVGRRRAA
jgi:hypothetical protein